MRVTKWELSRGNTQRDHSIRRHPNADWAIAAVVSSQEDCPDSSATWNVWGEPRADGLSLEAHGTADSHEAAKAAADKVLTEAGYTLENDMGNIDNFDIGKWEDSKNHCLLRHRNGTLAADIQLDENAAGDLPWTWCTWHASLKAHTSGRAATFEDAKEAVEDVLRGTYTLEGDPEVDVCPNEGDLAMSQAMVAQQHATIVQLITQNTNLATAALHLAADVEATLATLARARTAEAPDDADAVAEALDDCDGCGVPATNEHDVGVAWAQTVADYAPALTQMVVSTCDAAVQAQRDRMAHEITILDKVGVDKFLEWERTRITNMAEVFAEAFKPFLEPLSALTEAVTKAVQSDADGDADEDADGDEDADEDDLDYVLQVLVHTIVEATAVNQTMEKFDRPLIMFHDDQAVYDIGNFKGDTLDLMDDLVEELMAQGLRVGLSKWMGGGEDVE